MLKNVRYGTAKSGGRLLEIDLLAVSILPELQR